MKVQLLTLCFVLIFSSLSFANEASDYITALRARDVEGQLVNSDLYTRCANQADTAIESDGTLNRDTEIQNCFATEFQNTSDEDLQQLSSNLNIQGLEFEKTETNKSLRQYLSERIHDAIHGEGSYGKNKLKEMKFVDQGLFFRLYESQIHKNITLEFAKYCLENAGKKGNPNYFTMFASSLTNTQINERLEQGKKLKISEINIMDTYKVADEDGKDNNGRVKYKKTDWTKTSKDRTAEPNTIFQASHDFNQASSKFGDVFHEYNYCTRLSTDPNDPCHKDKGRNANLINMLKGFELDLSKNTSAGSLGAKLGNRFVLCSKVIVPTACEAFRCRNTYTWPATTADLDNDNSLMGKKLKNCRDVLGIDRVGSTGPDTDKSGKIACNVVSKIVDYKKTLELIKQKQQELNDDFKVAKGLNVNDVFAGKYNPNGEDIDKITSISSKEIKEASSTSVDTDELRARCIVNGELNATDAECADLKLEDEDIDKLKQTKALADAETAAYLERVRRFRDSGMSDEDELRTLIIENGLATEATVEDYISNTDRNDIVQIIENKYKADRQAIIATMNDRLYEVLNRDKSQADTIRTNFAEDQINDLEGNKDRVETLFNYTNIVTSYVSLVSKDGDGNQGSPRANTIAREIEESGFTDDTERQQYEEFFNDEDDQSSSGGSDAGFYSTESLINDIGDFASVDN